MKTHMLSLIAFTIGLSACQGGSEKGAEAPQGARPVSAATPAPQPEVIETEKKVVARDGIEIVLTKDSNSFLFHGERRQFIESLNKYTVFVRIPPLTLRNVRIYKVDLDRDFRQELNYDDSNAIDGKLQFTDTYELPKEKYKAQRISYIVTSDDGETIVEAKFKLLPDLYATGETGALKIGLNPGETVVANVVLEKAVFKTEGFNYHIKTENIFSEDSKITSFNDSTLVAAMGMPGRSGGLFKVEAKHADGDLTIELHGEKGGPGYPGVDNSDKPKGKDGAPGQDGHFADAGEGMCFDRNNTLTREEVSLPPPDEEISRRCPPQIYCSKAPTNGERGEDGVPGGNGYPGSSGGNAGRFELIHEQGTLSIHNRSLAGEGGEGGAGGAGGSPGLGGAPGGRGWKNVCPAAQKGADGSKGKTGDQGKKGSDGNFEKSCVIKNEQKICS